MGSLGGRTHRGVSWARGVRGVALRAVLRGLAARKARKARKAKRTCCNDFALDRLKDLPRLLNAPTCKSTYTRSDCIMIEASWENVSAHREEILLAPVPSKHTHLNVPCSHTRGANAYSAIARRHRVSTCKGNFKKTVAETRQEILTFLPPVLSSS